MFHEMDFENYEIRHWFSPVHRLQISGLAEACQLNHSISLISAQNRAVLTMARQVYRQETAKVEQNTSTCKPGHFRLVVQLI